MVNMRATVHLELISVWRPSCFRPAQQQSYKMTKEETAEVEEAQPASEFTSPVHEPRKRPMVHPSAQAPLPKDYGTSPNPSLIPS